MIEMGKKYQTRDGRAVEILRNNIKNESFPIVGIIAERDGSETQDRWTAEGWYRRPITGIPDNSDLIPITEKHHGYVIISKDVSPAILGNIVWNMHQAAESRRLAAVFPKDWIVIPVDWET
jgi:hypothetical protein